MPFGIKCEHFELLNRHNITAFFGAKNNLPGKQRVLLFAGETFLHFLCESIVNLYD